MRRTPDQLDDDRMLRDSARGFLEDRCAWTAVRPAQSALAKTRGAIAELGWFAMGLREEHGGLGADALQSLAVIEEAGRVLLPISLAADVLIAPRLMRRSQALAALAPRLASGDIRFAHVPDTPRDGGLTWSGGRLGGRSALSLGAASATHWLVEAGARSPNGAALLLVEAGGAALDTQRLFDGREGSTLTFSGEATATPLATGHEALDLIREVEDCAVAAAVADAYGAVASGMTLAVEYLNQRKQFGQTLGSFQAVQHQMADAFCDLETLRSLMLWLGSAIDGEPAERARAAAAAKIALGREGLAAASRMIQVCGGIAMTEDYRIGLIYKRLQVSAALHGGTEHHIKRLAAMTLPAIGGDTA